MVAWKHIAVGVAASVLPDVIMATYPWKGELQPDDPLARAHRFLHSPSGLLAVFVLAYALHVILDWFTHPPYLYRKDIDTHEWNTRQAEWRTANEQRRR